jgi:hypothetical protein
MRSLDVAFDRAMRQASAIDARILHYIDKYMGILGVTGPRPAVALRDHLGYGWLGRTIWRPWQPETTLIEIQRAILDDDRTLERVVAHEMVHHRNDTTQTASDFALLKLGIRPEGHGHRFLEGAARINAVMGEGFVTRTSDQSHVKTPSTREYLILISSLRSRHGQFGWAWAVRLGPVAKEWVVRKIAEGSRLVRVRDDRWAHKGPKIERYGRYGLPTEPEDAEMLRQLYERGETVTP